MKKVAIKLSIAIPLISGLLLSGCTNDSQIDSETDSSNTPSESTEQKNKDSNSSDSSSINKKEEDKSDEKKTKSKKKSKKSKNNSSSSSLDASSALNKLKVSDENTSKYSRSKFKHWSTVEGTGCDTRTAVLIKEAKDNPKMDGCTVKSGKWVSEYDGEKFTNPSKMDIDHMVPLNETWRSGAYKWDADTRESYANDLGYKNTLIAVSAHSNRSKSDKDPANWMPDKDECGYTANWISVKTRWNLTIDEAEKKTLTNLVQGCDGLKIDKVKKAKIVKDNNPPANEKKTKKKTSESKSKSSKSSKTSKSSSKTDPKFKTCTAAKAKGFGPYKKGKDKEYEWYQDRDKDGMACE